MSAILGPFGRRVLAVLLATALLAAACGDDDDDGGGGGGTDGAIESLTIATTQPVNNLNGVMGNLLEIYRVIYSALTQLDPSGDVVADLATEWTPNEDASTWTFTLREGVKFSDGSDLTAEDVVFTYESILGDPASLQNFYTAGLDSVTAPGDGTVVFELAQSNSAWPRQVTLIPIVSKAAYEQLGAEAFATTPVGSGPYQVISTNGTDTVELEVNPNYYGEAPAAAKVTIKTVEDQTTRLNGLQSGEFDLTMLSGPAVETAKGAGVVVQSQPGSKVVYLGFNVTAAPLGEADLRRAVTHAVDRGSITSVLLEGLAEPINQLLAPITFGHDSSIEVPPFDVEEARRLVAEAGYDGETIILQYPAEGGFVTAAPEVAQAVLGYLTEAGIEVSLETSDQATFLTDWFSKQLKGMFLFSIQSNTLDATQVYQLLFPATGTFENAELTSLFEQQLGETDEAARKQLLSEFAGITNEEAYYVPLFVDYFTYAHSTDISFDYPADGLLLPQNVRAAG
jgi:peptide/nickel transport system substrate-binding protein